MESIARILLLVLIAALLLAYMHGGWQGVSKWLQMKFVGEGGK